MVSKVKVILLSMAALFIVSAVVAPGALAAEERPHWVVAGKELKESEKVQYKSIEGGAYKLEAEGLPKIECEKQTLNSEKPASENFIQGFWLNQEWILFGSCHVIGAPLCSVPNIHPVYLQTLIVWWTGRRWWIIVWPHGPFVGGKFVTIKVEGKECALKGSFEVTGSEILEPSQKESEKEEAKPTVKSTNLTGEYENPENSKKEVAGELKFGAKKATLTGTSTVELEGGKAFGVNNK